jgi:hypothetical protein
LTTTLKIKNTSVYICRKTEKNELWRGKLMKKLKIFVVTVAMLANIGGTAFAEGVDSFKDNAGITPDSILYGVDKALENVKLSITFTGEGKVEVLSDIAEERLGESEAMAEAGNED